MKVCSETNLIAKQQKPRKSGTAVLWPLPFEAVGQQQNNAILPLPSMWLDSTSHGAVAKNKESLDHLPLLFRRGNKLVDDDLSTVAEVTELRLPQHQSHGRFHGKPVPATSVT